MAENENEQTGGGLRAQLEAALAEVAELKGQVESAQGASKELAFLKAGIDTSKGPGRLIAERYDGELSPDAIKAFTEEFSEEYGITVEAGQTEQPSGPDEQQERMGALRNESTPEGAGKRLSHTEWSELSRSDPPAAMEAHRNGLVDFPPEIAQNLEANRSAVRLGG